MKNSFQLSILVATCERPEMLKACVQSLLAQQTGIQYEIIVLNQSGFEKLNTFSFDPKVRLVHCDFKNKSRALNLGIKLASSDYIAVIDDDCIADKNWISNLSNALRSEGSISIITGRVMAGSQETDMVLSRLHDAATERMIFKKKWITPIFKLSGCNFGFHKKIYEIVGPFNENLGPGSPFKSSDDNEWSYRAANLGFPIIYIPEAMVEHRSWRNVQEDLQLMKDYGYAAGALFKTIFKSSKLDFLYHNIQLHWWLLNNIFFSFDTHEIKAHTLYGLSLYKGFFKYHCGKVDSLDYLFVLSPGKYIGGAERYIQSLAKELQNYDRKIIIAISHNREFYLECKKSFPTIYLGDTLRDASIILKNLLRNRNFKVVISSGYHSSYLVSLARFRNLPQKSSIFIDIKHGWITTNLSERLKTFFDKFLSIFYDAVIIVDPQMKQKLWFINRKRIIFIPSPVSVNDITADYTNTNTNNCFRILLIGRLSGEKRFDIVLEALSRVPNQLWELTVVGNGPHYDSLKEMAKRNGIIKKVNFVGYQKNVLPFYQNADLLIISSINEGCPLVALEAMANNVLILSTSVGYMPVMLNENRGFLVDVNITTAGLADKIKEIISLDRNIKDEMLRRARDFVEKNHNLSKNVKIIDNLVNKLKNI